MPAQRAGMTNTETPLEGPLRRPSGFTRVPAISLTVFLIVLAAAALHAGWNAMLKVGLEPLAAMVLINGAAGLVALPFLFWTGWPIIESWPYLVASVIIHLGYYFALAAAYARADMSQVYPVARGSAPLLTGLVSILALREPVSMQGALGIALLAFGIFVMSLKSAQDAARMDRKALAFAGLTAVTICGYTLADGWGARVSGDPFAYSAALFFVDGVFFTLFTLVLKGWRWFIPMANYKLAGVAGGAMSGGAYSIAIWAMTVAPIPLVAAVRETSVLFGAAIAVLILKEPLRVNRVIAAVLIVAGLVMIRLQ
jgi:drug/metabolite transporter (DMT)-like permease